MRLVLVMLGVGVLSLGFAGLATSGLSVGLCKAQTEEAIRFVERFLDSAPDGFDAAPMRRG
ncbi:hypothetical protein ACFELO_12360 [Oceanicaulis sp. LC35]|uniref:hypothetical protein n=1 Tax=Oceanicaulis sp. LC35 TaxID=3349635 RepID=UPI003F8397D5